MRMARNNARQRILDASLTVSLRNGAAHLTLDAVAAEAGVSKGGLLYHFADKQALLAGLLEAALQHFDDAVLQRAAADSRPGALVRAYAEASESTASALPDLFPALLAAAAHDPALLAPAQDHFRRWQQRLEADGVDPVDALLVRLAADGLWFADAYGLAPPTGARRRALLARLVQRAAGD
jgi:AcrR family transcriptional regulator